MDNELLVFAGIEEYDWAAKLIDPKAHEAWDKGDAHEKLNMVKRLLTSRKIAKYIITVAEADALSEYFGDNQ